VPRVLQAAAEIAPLMTQSLNFGRLMLMLVARLKEGRAPSDCLQ
jgi:hypothetical protein